MSDTVMNLFNIFETQVLCEVAILRDSHQNNRADFPEKFKDFMRDRFNCIMHQIDWLFNFPDLEMKAKSIVKVETEIVPEATPGTSYALTPKKRSSSESLLSKSPKKHKIENDLTEHSENNNGTENGAANGEGSRTPVTRSHSKEIPSVLFGFSFYCGNCDGEPFESPDQVHKHWKDTHVGEKTDPFTFRVSNLSSCLYCGQTGAYATLRAHNCTERGTKPIVFVDLRDDTQCAMCAFKGENIVAHSQAEHGIVPELKILSPIAINEASLKELLDFNLHKKIKCGFCKNEFATEHQFHRHNREHHPNMTPKPIRKFKSEPKLYLPCCNMTIDEKVFVFHFQNHPPNFACLPCNQNYPTLNDLIEHDKNQHGVKDASEKRLAEFKRQLKKYYLSTEVRYPNGLVVNVQNLLGTNHSKEPDFNAFIADLAKVKQEKSNGSGSASQAK